MDRSLAKLLRAAREQKSLTQQDVATRLRVSRAAVGQWESGKTKPSADNLVRLAIELGIDDFASLSIDSAISQPDLAEIVSGVVRPPTLSRERTIVDNLRAVSSIVSELLRPQLPLHRSSRSEDGDLFFVDRRIWKYLLLPLGAALSVEGATTRPTALATFIATDSMSPRYRFGDIILCEQVETLAIGDEVLIELSRTAKEGWMLCTLGAITSVENHNFTLQQLWPISEKMVYYHEVNSFFRVLTRNELIGPAFDRE